MRQPSRPFGHEFHTDLTAVEVFQASGVVDESVLVFKVRLLSPFIYVEVSVWSEG